MEDFERTVAPGLELRLLNPNDARVIFQAVERNREALRQWLPWVDGTGSEADIERFAQLCRGQWDAGLGPQCTIWRNREFAGCLGVHAIDWPHRNCSIGYWLDAAYQGSGIVTKCCASILDYLLIELGLHRVEIRCGTGNSRSCAIPERLGFTREGVLRQAQCVGGRWIDLVVWSMLAPDWPSHRRS